jgi:hypothetical protein
LLSPFTWMGLINTIKSAMRWLRVEKLSKEKRCRW